MAQRVIRQLIDDVDGTDIADGKGESIEFSVRGISYRIDLSEANSAKFDKALKPYLDAASRLGGGGRQRKSTASKSKSSPEHLAAIRAWARKKGYEVSDRGRIPAAVVEAFDAAH